MDIPTVHSTEYHHIALGKDDIPFIAGTTMKVAELVMAQMSYGWTPEEIHINHRYLSMSQIYSALAYYWDHKQTIDADIQRREAYVRQVQQSAGESPLVAKLRAQGIA
ncbi:MAG: DUF433 domain-containing protein [Cyanobacteria bacterium P01_F01_bin.4]